MKTIAIMVTVGSVSIAGCGSSTARRISAAVARNAVAVGAVKEFRDHHRPLDGVPTCTTRAIAGSNTKMTVTCRGKTKAGEPASVTGRTAGANEVRGTFTGLVAGTKVFTTSCIGC